MRCYVRCCLRSEKSARLHAVMNRVGRKGITFLAWGGLGTFFSEDVTWYLPSCAHSKHARMASPLPSLDLVYLNSFLGSVLRVNLVDALTDRKQPRKF